MTKPVDMAQAVPKEGSMCEVRTEKPFNCHCMFLTSRNRQDGSNFSCGNWGSEQVSGLPRGHGTQLAALLALFYVERFF